MWYDPLRHSRTASAVALAAAIALAAAPAAAQAPPSPHNLPPPTATQPDPRPCAEPYQQPQPRGNREQSERRGSPPTTGEAPPLSDQLARGDGVLCPPRGVDPDIVAPTPDVGRMPVLPPPGGPGGDPRVRPK